MCRRHSDDEGEDVIYKRVEGLENLETQMNTSNKKKENARYFFYLIHEGPPRQMSY